MPHELRSTALGRAVIGQRTPVEEVLTAFFPGGLLPSFPDLAKTLLIGTPARPVRSKFKGAIDVVATGANIERVRQLVRDVPGCISRRR
jgi:hypothetical protein